MQTSLRLSTKFWLGAVVPAIGLALVFAAAIASGRGKGEAPMLVFFVSLVAVPAVLLLNCWVLFVAWSSPMRMLTAASMIPAVVGIGAVLVVHGTGRWVEAGMFLLFPFLLIPETNPRAVGAVWAVMLLVVLLAARAVQRARQPRRATPGESSAA
jgi:hypothetical protein